MNHEIKNKLRAVPDVEHTLWFYDVTSHFKNLLGTWVVKAELQYKKEVELSEEDAIEWAKEEEENLSRGKTDEFCLIDLEHSDLWITLESGAKMRFWSYKYAGLDIRYDL